MRSSADPWASKEAGKGRRVRPDQFRRLLVAVALLVLVSLPAAALASDSPGTPGNGEALSGSSLKKAQAAQDSLAAQLTDAKAATELPHNDLGRSEALQLLEGVFEPLLQSAAGDYDSLEVAKFLSNNAALVYPPAQEAPGFTAGGEAAAPPSDTPALLESSVPLRVIGPDGSDEVVDLSLEQAEGELRSAAPLEPVAIPQQLGDGIELPGAGIGIELVGAPQERAPSIIEESVAAYPNVDTDTDLVVAPTPTGVETLTTLRTPEAPRTQTFRLDLPAGASLIEAEHGAEVVGAGETLLRVMPASAIDAAGASVPVSMTVSDDSLVVTVSPQAGAAYPILVDPLMEGFAWKTGATPTWAGWDPWTNNGTIIPGFGENWGAGWKGTYIEAQANYYAFGAQAGWTHTVPRLAQEEAKGRYPTSYIKSFSVQGLYFITSAGLASPFLFAGIFDPSTQKWAGKPGNEAVWSYPGNAAWAWGATLNFENGTPGARDKAAQKAYGMSLAVSEPGWLGAPRASYLGAAALEILDEDTPTVANTSAPTGWVDQTAAGPITVDALDTGLGVKNVTFVVPGQSEKTIGNTCGGQTQDPCPREQTVSLPASMYSPASMPQGINYVKIRALDVLWNATPENKLAGAQVKVDHTKPSLTLSGTLTEQGTLGTTLPQYTLKYAASDGTEAAPQSGAASTEVKVDGTLVEPKYAPGCATKNCAINREWTLDSSQYSTGSHTVEVIATDGVGLSTSKTQSFTLDEDTSAPSLNASGSFFEGPEGWLNQESYLAEVGTADPGGYGVKEVKLKVDGSVVKAVSQSCAAGGCGASLSKSMNMSIYAGGAHEAEVVAIDGAGNVATESWTINVNPSGAVPTDEATATLEAVEGTDPEANPVAPTEEVLDPGEVAEGNNPSLERSGELLVSEGTPAASTVEEGSGMITIETTDEVGEESFQLTPVESEGTDAEVVAGAAGVLPNTGPQVDTVVRPKYAGALTFQSIRSIDAPSGYSWEVSLQEGQTIEEAEDAQSATVCYEDGTPAMFIAAEPARDALGHGVPTSISVEGNIVTLTVDHTGDAYVYPVIAGTAFEVGYTTVEVFMPPPPPTSEEAEALRSVQNSRVTLTVGVPVVIGGETEDQDGAKASWFGSVTKRQPWQATQCEEHTWPIPGCSVWEEKMTGWFFYNGKKAWWKKSQPEPQCIHDPGIGYEMNHNFCGWKGPNHQPYGNGYHITAQSFFDVLFLKLAKQDEHQLTVRMFGSGGVYAHKDEPCVCNPSRP